LAQSTIAESTGTDEHFHLARIVFSLSTIALCTKFFGFAEKFVIAHFFGTTDTADVYFSATAIVLSIVWLVKELVNPSLLPVFADSLSKLASVSANLFRRAFLSTAAFVAVVAVVLALFSDPITRVLVPGFPEPKRLITAGLLRSLAPATFLLGLGAVTHTILNARKNFLKAVYPEAALKLFVVVGLVGLLPVMGIKALAVVMGLGAFSCLIAQLYFIPESRFLLGKTGRPGGREDHFRKMLHLMGPLVIGVIFSHLSGLIDNLLASTLPSGHLAYLGYSKKLIDALLFIGPVVLVTVVYSHLSHFAAAGDYGKFAEMVLQSFRLLVYLTIPAACVLIGLRQPLIRFLLQRGQFTAESTTGTSNAFMIYTLGLTTFSVEALLVHSFFAFSDTRTPVKFGILCVFLDIALAIALLKPLGYVGIAGAFVVSKTVKIVLLGSILNKRIEGLFGSGMLMFLAKLGIAAGAVWLILKLLLGIDNAESVLHTFVFDLMMPGLGALLMFIACSYLLRIDEFKAMVSILKHRRAGAGISFGDE
jgi:putative peptidoglycan lipid II flippase